MSEVAEAPEDDEFPTCPVCRDDMAIKMLAAQSDNDLGLFWGKYCHECPTCGHRGDTWEVLD